MQFKSLLAGSAMLALLAGCASSPMEQQQEEAATAQATYQGSLPCRNCDGIDLDVTMVGEDTSAAEERTFTLNASYRNHPKHRRMRTTRVTGKC
ncbi:hypothetical protein HSBAA_54990 [Vreelandella sulfidaeris]|uniref:Copper resistance protein NlpE n=1 Tax=Vreelandella sulfidaeris TaxID=115553 RepID=A0A455UFT5_9GAMM|nr:hypothetical protein HSBAA_54990 [Halomonas sulfidaeris]